MNFKFLTTVWILFSALMVCSCNSKKNKSFPGSTEPTVTKSELDREEVRKIMKTSFGYPRDLVRAMPSGDLYIQNGWPNTYEKSLVSMGYRVIHGESPCRYSTNVLIEFTDKAAPYIQSKRQLKYSDYTGEPLCNDKNIVVENMVILCTANDAEVVSLRKITETEYEAEIQLTFTYNDIGRMYFQNNGALSLTRVAPEILRIQKVTFLKYDDGWKPKKEIIDWMHRQLVFSSSNPSL